MEKDKDDLFNPDDFDDLEDEEVTDGKETDSTDKDEESNSNDSDGKAKVQKEEDESSKEQNAKKNSEFARKRREKEEAERLAREEKIKNKAKTEAKLELLKVNPFTQEKMVDEDDLEIYEIQKQLDEEGLDPVADLPKRLAEIKRKEREASAKKDEEEAKLKEKIGKDLDDFKKKYPKVNTKELSEDEGFMKFANDKIGRWTTAEIYEMYNLQKKNNSAKEEEAMTENKVGEVAGKMTKSPSSNPNGRVQQKSIENLNPYSEADRKKMRDYMREKYGE